MKRKKISIVFITFCIFLRITAAGSDNKIDQLLTKNRIFPFCFWKGYKKSSFAYAVTKALSHPIAVTRLTDTYFINAVPLYGPHHLTMMVAYEKSQQGIPCQLHVFLSILQFKKNSFRKKDASLIHYACLIGTTLETTIESSSETDSSVGSLTNTSSDNKTLLAEVRKNLIANEFRVRSVCDSEQKALDSLGYKPCNPLKKKYIFFKQQQALLTKPPKQVILQPKKRESSPLKILHETTWDDCS